MTRIINLSNGTSYISTLAIWDDHATEHPGRYALYWQSPDGRSGVRADERSFRTIRDAREFGQHHFGERAVRS